jgi:hypothetical protein
VDIDKGIARQPDQLGIVVNVSPGQCAEERSVLGRAMEVVDADPMVKGRFADRQAVSDDWQDGVIRSPTL